MNKKLKIGLFGFGCVGQGLYDVLNRTKGIEAVIDKICVKDRDKKRSLPGSRFTFDKYDLLNDPELNIIVELIDDSQEAFEIVSAALRQRKAVVSANKKMISEHFGELYRLQQQYKVPFLYEASVCGSIPIIRNLEEYYDNDLLSSVEGICNGTTNYILTQTETAGKDYSAALKEAQQLGFAESNPRLDVLGFDSKYKLTILLAHAFGLLVRPEEVLNCGIGNLCPHDSNFAREKGYRIKLVAHAFKSSDEVSAYVLPRFVRADDLLYNVSNEYNAALVQAQFSDRQFFVGKGAGSHPTASAVLSDISALQFDYRYAYKKAMQRNGTKFSNDVDVRVYIRFQDEKVLLELGVSDMEAWFTSPGYRYVIGRVNVGNLLELNLNERKDIFTALI